MQDDLAKMSLDELKEVAREKGLKGISKLRKSEILARLTESGEAVLPAEKNASEPKHTVKAKDNDKETASAALVHATSLIQKGATKHIFHKNTAARKVSRLTNAVNAL